MNIVILLFKSSYIILEVVEMGGSQDVSEKYGLCMVEYVLFLSIFGYCF